MTQVSVHLTPLIHANFDLRLTHLTLGQAIALLDEAFELLTLPSIKARSLSASPRWLRCATLHLW
jgi:hypothetical protein